MLDILDAALFYPSRDCAYFFRGPHYIKYRPGSGVVLLSGRVLRRIGIDGWKSFPDSWRTGIDAALYYPPRAHAYFFRGAEYLKYRPGEGVVPLADGRVVRKIGVDGWTSFPAEFAAGIDAALFYPTNSHAYFFKGGQYIKYRPGSGVVPIGSRKIRVTGEDGWTGLPGALGPRLDAALHYPSNGKVYFFAGRDYARWDPHEGGLDARYPRRLGLLHRARGGWPGLSHVVAGPLLGPTTDRTARLWMWMTDAESAGALSVRLNGVDVSTGTTDPVVPALVGATHNVDAESVMRILELSGLTPATAYTAEVRLGSTVLDRVDFRTAPEPATVGRVVIAFGSCANMSASVDVPAFEAMRGVKADLGLLCGDNCYYVHGNGATSPDGPPPRDWESRTRMLIRQVEARNHPQFSRLSRCLPLYSTWDDHDFGYNNAQGTDSQDGWVGPLAASAIFRAMWPNQYADRDPQGAVHHSFRWGPIEVFMTDSRFHRDSDAHVVWGKAQLRWLIDGLLASTAPVKIVVTSGQFLFNRDDQEGHARDGAGERKRVLDHVLGATGVSRIPGRVLFVSGDVHFSELMRLPGQGPAETLEFTSSPLRRAGMGLNPKPEKEPGSRIWAVKRNGFGVIRVDVRRPTAKSPIAGTITLECRDAAGNLLSNGATPCRSTWDLATGAVT